MPTIQIKKKDLEQLLSRSITIPELIDQLPLVKGEIKSLDESTGEMKLELNDTNRPDLWCAEGIARQLKAHGSKKPGDYPFYEGKHKPACMVQVAPTLKNIRPYIGACLARDVSIDEETLIQLIQTQEKISDGFGRKRRLVSIGLYRLPEIVFPVFYKSVSPEAVRFVPLGMDMPMTLAEILDKHPKGIAYANILSKASEYPLLVDGEDKILSFPPIINSRELGEVQVGDRHLFVEVTGTDLRMVILTINILAANLADRGAKVSWAEIRYPYRTDFGQKIIMPRNLADPLDLTLGHFESALGERPEKSEVISMLKSYGYHVKSRGNRFSVSVPAYRDDLLHPVDVVEDFAISRGFESFEAEMPSEFTIGGLSPLEQFSDKVREMMVGMGYQEVISNILTNPEESIDRMNLSHEKGSQLLVSVENVMSQTYSALRKDIVPSLLRVEAASSKSFYPHRLFEVGEVAVTDNQCSEGTRTMLRLAGLIAHPSANFSELHSSLDLLMYYLGRSYELEPVVHPSFLEGRVGRMMAGHQDLGLIGELHPQVLENWTIAMPCCIFEISLSDLLGEEA